MSLPVPLLLPPAAGKGRWEEAGAGRALLGHTGCARRCRAGALLWKLGKHPGKSVGAELGAEGGNPPVGCWALPQGLRSQTAARVPFLLLLSIAGEGNGINLAWEAGAPSIQILPHGADLWSLNPCGDSSPCLK